MSSTISVVLLNIFLFFIVWSYEVFWFYIIDLFFLSLRVFFFYIFSEYDLNIWQSATHVKVLFVATEERKGKEWQGVNR